MASLPVGMVARDLVRLRRAWRHDGPTDEPRSRFWTYKRESWTPQRRWLPYLGGDEWCRWTLVLPIPFAGYLVTALWACRNPACESCAHFCQPR